MTKNQNKSYFRFIKYLIWFFILIVLNRVLADTHFKLNHPVIDSALTFLTIIYVGIVIYIFANREKWFKHIPIINAFVFTSFIIMMYHPTDLSTGGMTGDQFFLTMFVTKLHHYGWGVDMSFKDLSSYYPNLYYYLWVKAVNLLNCKPHEAIFYGLLGATFFVPIISYELWRKVINEKMAIMLSFSVLFFQDMYKPAAWLAVTILTPWYLYYIENIRNAYFSNKDIFIGGILMGLVIHLQFYYLMFFGLLFFVLRAIEFFKTRSFHFKRYVPKIYMSVIAFAVASPFLVPYIIDLTTYGSDPAQNKFYHHSMSYLPIPFGIESMVQLFSLAAIVWSILNYNKEKVIKYLLILLLSIWGWVFLGDLLKEFDFPILHFKIFYLQESLLSILIMLVVYELQQQYGILKRLNKNKFLMLFTLFLVMSSVAFYRSEESNYEQARKCEINNDILSEFDTLTQGMDLKSSVFIIENHWIQAFRPVFSFYCYDYFITHPAAQIHKRYELLVQLSSETDPKKIRDIMLKNHFGKIDAILLPKEKPEINLYMIDAGGTHLLDLNNFDKNYFDISFGKSLVLIKPRKID